MSDIYRPPESDLTPRMDSPELGGSIEATLAGQFQFSPPGVIGDAFSRIKGVKRYILVAALVYIVVGAILGTLQTALVVALAPGEGAGFFVFSWLLEVLTNSFIMMPLFAGGLWIALRHLAGKPLSFELMFSQLPKFVNIGVMYLIMAVLLFIGFALLILPGIYLAIAYSLALPLMIDRDLSPWQALETSRKLVNKCWWRSLALFLLIMLILIASSVLLLIPLIWTLPAAALSMGIFYRNLAGIRNAAQD
jgi:uncharacterized membrane protein